MRNGVYFIFKTLIKVPCYIFVSYLILNIFAFSYSYLQMVSLYYTVNGVAMENNYIPTLQYSTIKTQMLRCETTMLRNIEITSSTPTRLADRKQFGEQMIVGVQGEFHWLWPIMPTEKFGGVDGVNGSNKSSANSDYENKSWEEINSLKNNHGAGFLIRIQHTVPAIKYYADDDL